MYPVIDREKCMGCGNCVEICPSEVYKMEENKSTPVSPEACIECGACVDQCPVDSIKLCED